MPAVVARGAKGPGVGPPLLPCALCHLPNGAGHVESASLAGLPAAYIERQFGDWRSGARRIGVGDRRATEFLTALKRRYTKAQVAAAALYFSSLEPIRWIRVVESDSAPSSTVSAATLVRLPRLHGASEPLGERIVELPEDPARLLIRDAHSGFVAFVPRGSLTVGRRLVTLPLPGVGLPACPTCHGADLTGASAPPLAGRGPTYLVRQLWSFQSGDRNGGFAAPMRVVARKLTASDMLAIAAYLASLQPDAGRASDARGLAPP